MNFSKIVIRREAKKTGNCTLQSTSRPVYHHLVYLREIIKVSLLKMKMMSQKNMSPIPIHRVFFTAASGTSKFLIEVSK